MVQDSMSRDKAYDLLKTAILRGELEPDDIISVGELSRRFGLTRTPARDALLRLNDEGLVRVLPRKGILVSGVSTRRLRNLLEVRLALECYVAERAAALASDGLIKDLRDNLQTQKEALARQDDLAFLEADQKMHLMLSSLLNNRELTAYLLSIRKAVYGGGPRTLTIATSFNEAFDEHTAIVEAVASRNPHKSRTAMERHLRRHRSQILVE
jgi:DNA-binding GntR family transcriptional regulator